MLTLQKYQGFYYLEVLLAWAIVAFAGIGIATLQLKEKQWVQNAYWQSVATLQLRNMVVQLGILKNAEARLSAISQWNNENIVRLPQGHGDISCRQAGHFCILTITWGKKQKFQQTLSVVI